MPVAGSSRRTNNARRRDLSDGIEEEDSRRPEREDVDDGEDSDDDQPRRRAKAVKKEKKPNIHVEDDKEEDDGEEQFEDPLKNFSDQPLGKAQAVKLVGMASDWSMTRQAVRGGTINLITDVASSVAEFGEGEKSQKVLSDLDTTMRELIDADSELTAQEIVLNEINQKVNLKEDITDVVERYEREMKNKLNAYKNKTTRQKYAKNDDYVKFKSSIYEVQNPDTAMPPLTDMIPREDGDDSDDDDDVQVGGITQDYRCPLTLTILVNPLTSMVCHHSFSADAIQEFLGPSHTTTKKCPASGCNKYICLNDLKDDKELAKKAKDAARRERMREDDSDEEDVVE
ncbi:predicted protein [Sparassis crispa]|uniref:SP-RING-type domain-containing protein n=1 Tax=Sparassis crispa TaxID=139825 RepID=A0A401GT94_9APHY|nr:predicted protein [Sparassis crispa]GBE84954.1 predicted protein [Sparassis crispa]